MAELESGQYFIANTDQAEFWGKVLEVKNEIEYLVTLVSDIMLEIKEQRCKVYYQNKEGADALFYGSLSLDAGNYILQQADNSILRRRQSARFKIDLPVVIKREDLIGNGMVKEDIPGKEGVRVRTFNLSTGGAGIISEVPLQINSSLILELNLYGEKIKAVGAVKYCIEKEGVFLSGIEFSVISDPTRKKVEEILLALTSL